MAPAYLARDLGLADGCGVEPGGDEEQVFTGAFALPGLQCALGIARCGGAAGQQFVNERRRPIASRYWNQKT